MSHADFSNLNTDNDFKPDLEAYKSICPDRKYSVDSWNPVGKEQDDLARYIEKKKKIDPFYKKHADSLSNPTYVLLKLIETGDYFPKVLRRSKLAIRGGGTGNFGNFATLYFEMG